MDLIVLGEVGSLKPLFRNKFLKSTDLQKALKVKPSLAIIRDIIFSMEISLTKKLSIVLAFFFGISQLSTICGWADTLHGSFLDIDACDCDFKSMQCLLLKCVTNPFLDR